MLGCTDNIDTVDWFESYSTDKFYWNPSKPEPLFERLDLESILEYEKSLADSKDNESSPDVADIGDGLIEFEDFVKVEMRTERFCLLMIIPMQTNYLLFRFKMALILQELYVLV